MSSAANFVKPGNAVSKWIDKNIIEAGEAKQSDVVKAEKQRLNSDLAAADGVGDEVAAVGRYIVNNPVLSAAQAAGSFVGPGLAVKGATTAARAVGAGAKAVERAGRAGGVAAGAAMAGGDAAGTAHDLATQAGATDEQAVTAGRQASVIPAIVGGVGGAFGAEKLLAGAKGFAGGTAARALKTGASEALQEGIEEGVTQYEGQRAAVPYDPNIDPSKGVAGAAAMGAALGGITGAGMGAFDGIQEARRQQASDPFSQAVAAQQSAGQDVGSSVAHGEGTTAAAPEQQDADREQFQASLGVRQAPVLDEARLREQGVTPATQLNAEALDRALGVASPMPAEDSTETAPPADGPAAEPAPKPSEAMGLDANAGALSAAAVQAVDSGAHEQMRQAETLAQAAEQAKAANPLQKKERGPQAQPDVDPQTGEIATGMAAWSDTDLSTAFRGAQSREVRLGLAKELQRRRAAREQQALQAELAAEQDGTSPGAERADTTFASVTEDAGAPPASTATTTGAPADGPTSTQAQQAGAQQPQAGTQEGPARADAATGAAAAPAGGSGLQAAGLTGGGAPTADAGAQATPAASAPAQAQGGEVEVLRQQLRDVEARILAVVPSAMGAGGGDIEAAMKSRKVPVTLKAQRKELLDQVRAARDAEVKTFAPETGTLGIARADMPQVPTQSHGGLVKHLNAQGIAHETTTVDAAALKPTQAEYSPAKVEAAKTAGGDRAVIVSSDGHIIDGHHQAMAAAEDGKPVKAIVLDVPVEQALEAVKNSPSAAPARFQGKDADKINPAIEAVREHVAGTLDKAALIERLRPLGLTEAQVGSVTYKLGDDWQTADTRSVLAAANVSDPRDTANTPATSATPAPGSRAAARIEDFGEELRGARKMLYAKAYADGMAQARELDVQAHPLSKTWPEPDYGRLLEGGATPQAVALVRALRDAVPTKPQTAWKLKAWAQRLQALRGFADDILAGRSDASAVLRELERAGIRDVSNQAALYEAVGHERSLKGVSLSSARYSMYEGVDYDPPRTIWTVEREAKGSAFGSWPRELANGDTREQAIAAFKRRAAELLAEEQAPTKGATFEIYSKRAGGAREFFIGKKIGRHVAELKAGFSDLKAARQYKGDHQAELEDLLAKYKAVPPVRNAQNAPRIGEDYRQGADVTPEQFQEAFGFRGVQFGNYVEGSRRQQDLNRAYDALMDLAGVLNLPPRSLSLGGRLGLAFGARGGGGANAAAAHYEPDTVVINLTKREGAGSLAHEWWHALDNYFSRQRGDGAAMMTEESRRGDGVREEMRAAFRDVMSAIHRTAMLERSRKLDERRTKEYWSTKPEMSARAFESYAIAKLQDQSAGNDYLANVVGDAAFALEGAYPYPTAGEMAQIREAFDAFFQTVETREEGGTTVLFRRDTAEPFDYEAMQRVVLGKPAGFSAAAREQAVSSVRQTVDAIRAAWGANAPEVVVAFDMQDAAVPESARQADLRQRSGGARGAPEGFYYRGKAYLMASRLNTPADATRVLFHEVLGHHGLRGKFGKDLDAVLNQVATMRKAEVDAKIKDYGLRGVSNLDRRTAAEEVLAEMAEKNPQLLFVRRAVAAIRNWLRTHVPGFKNLRLTDDDIIQAYILPARGWVERRMDNPARLPAQGVVAPAYSRSESTQAGYEARIDALFGGGKAQVGTRVLDRSDVMGLLGYPDVPLMLNESHLRDGLTNHPEMTAAAWKKVPEWIENPAMVYRSLDAKHPGRIVMVAPELLAGYPVVMAIEPSPGVVGGKPGQASTEQLLVTVFAKTTGVVPAAVAARQGRLLYLNKQNAQLIGRGGGVQFPKHDDVSTGRTKILTEKHLAGWRRANAQQEQGGGDGAMFSRSRETPAARHVGEILRSVTVTNLKQQTAFKATDLRPLGLQFLGRRQLVDVYGGMLPELRRYSDLMARMDADKNEAGAGADQLAKDWAKLTDERQLAELMHDATLAQIDPAKEYVAGDDRVRFTMLRGRYDGLSAQAKAVYARARDTYSAHMESVRAAIKERIERAEMSSERRAALLQRMDDEFFGHIKGVYFPLARFGQYVVVVKDAEGKVANVSRAETMAEADATRRQLLSAFPQAKGFTVGKVLKAKDFVAERDSVGRGFMEQLYGVLDKQGMDAKQRAELEDALGQLYLSSLPDLSWAKHGIHRKGTPGFSQDARRAFAQNVFHGASYLAKLRYGDQLQDELGEMQRRVDAGSTQADFDSVKAQQVVDEMVKRHDAAMNPKTNALSTALTSLGFMFHLGLSPASAMVNLTQTALVAFPVMGARWGFAKSSAALLKASQEAARGRNDITASLSQDEKAAFDEAVRSGVVDVTMAHDLAGIAQGEDRNVSYKLQPVMRAASFLFHHAEKFNRQVTFVAAYRLAREAGADSKQAYQQAVQATYDGHFDYSANNRPRVMQGNVARVVLLFKQYSQNMVYTLARNAQQSLKGATPEARAEARKALGGLLAMHGMAAGVLGLPMVTTLLAAASMLGGDDDEPWDAEVALRNMLADTFGQKAGEVLAHGLSRLTPWDISGRVGLDKLIFPDVQEGLEGQRLGESAMTAALGPVAGIGINVLKGAQEMSEGRYARGLEAMAPSVLRGPLKAWRYETEGVKDKTGIVVQDEVDAAALWGQAAGFSPSSVRNAYEGKAAIAGHDRALMARRSALVEQFAMAAMAGDEEGKAEAREAVARFNEKNPSRRILPMQLAQSVAARQKRIREAQEGVYLPAKRRDAMEQGRFVVAD
ncbi:PLxRFG domain-containing protein [Diaphorobacter sp. ED-3]|uniref:PLxRFG domain-containing protein n=1 Tax=Diaphorobacter sp. ED-3 TaxID=3016636 RepID=UPI0022DD8E63|nr:PLxRFG domain-containing protein [Diaphorobacter sp. ED-3]